jgi:hypothetical protein
MNFRDWFINEVRWKDLPSDYGFSDVVKTCIKTDKFVELLNAEIKRLNVKKGRERFFRSAEREPEKMLIPQFTRGNIMDPMNPVAGRAAEGEYEMQTIEEFAAKLTEEPKTVFDEGLKSKHTNELDPTVFTVNTGIPALRAIVYDKRRGKFYSINTCLGAGSCVMNCFALKGFYVMNDGKNMKLHQRINLLVNDPERYYEKALMELRSVGMRIIPPSPEFPEGRTLKIRWNDAGDWFSETYFNIARKITEELKKMEVRGPEISLFGKGKSRSFNFSDRINSNAYTKQHKYVELGRKHGITMNFSLGAKEGERREVDYKTTKISAVVPKVVFKDYFLKAEKDQEEGPVQFKPGKDREQLRRSVHSWALLNGYLERGTKLGSMLYTDELVERAEGHGFKYHVIVMPRGDSDISAQRRDVQWTFLLEH